MKKTVVSEIDVKDRTVFVRVDFNVPLDKEGNIIDDTRIRAALPTLEYLVFSGARLVLASHLGRPGGQMNPVFSLAPVARRLSQILEKPVIFNGLTIGKAVEKDKSDMQPGDVMLLENLRFFSQEKKNNPDFARELARGIDIYVNDAFGTCHRRHASIVEITEFVPLSVAGLLVQREIESLEFVLEAGSQPDMLILGGAKVKDKIPILQGMLNKVKVVLIGGKIACTFLAADGRDVGGSEVEAAHIGLCRSIMDQAKELGVRILLPVDHVAAVIPEPDVTVRMVSRGEIIPENMMGLDIGPQTVEIFKEEIKKAGIVVWNGPMGVFENETFAGGTMAIARAVAESRAEVIAGGGDTVAAILMAGVEKEISHLSTGGGAALEFISGGDLPGLENLKEKK